MGRREKQCKFGTFVWLILTLRLLTRLSQISQGQRRSKILLNLGVGGSQLRMITVRTEISRDGRVIIV